MPIVPSYDNVTRITIPGNTGSTASADAGELSWHDIVDTLNPLEHIPIISSLFDAQTGHTPSTVSKLVGGTLLGGPIGLIASFVGAVYEAATGESPGDTIVAALGGSTNSSATQYAAAKTGNTETADADAAGAQTGGQTAIAMATASGAKEMQTADAEDTSAVEARKTAAATVSTAGMSAKASIAAMQAQMAAATPNAAAQQAAQILGQSTLIAPRQAAAAQVATATQTPEAAAQQQKAVLSLYGASAKSAHRSYSQAQMRPYLQDVTTSQVL